MKKMNPSLKNGVIFGVMIGIFFIVQSGIIFGILAGVIGGSLFGFSFWGFFRIHEKMNAKKFSSFRADFAKSNDILYESAASCLKRGFSTEGRLYLTPKGLFFKSRKANVDTPELWIHYGVVKYLSPCEHGGSLGQGILIKQEDRREIRLFVSDSELWLEKIRPFVLQAES